MSKRKVGRPTKYKKKFAKMLIEYGSIEPNRVEYIVTDGKNDYHKEEPKLLPNNLPTLERFASNINVNVDVLSDWANAKTKSGKPKYPEFLRAYMRFKQLQKDILVANGLTGLYAGNFAIFVAKNFTDMKDKTEIDATSKGEKITGFNYIVPKDRIDDTDNPAIS